MQVSGNAVSAIDFARLREVSDDDAEMINELIELYFSQTREQLGELEKAIGEKDFDSVYRSAHKIAGGSLTCGMNAIVPPIRELEQAGRNQNGGNIEDSFAEARKAFARMEEYLQINREQLFV